MKSSAIHSESLKLEIKLVNQKQLYKTHIKTSMTDCIGW